MAKVIYCTECHFAESRGSNIKARKGERDKWSHLFLIDFGAAKIYEKQIPDSNLKMICEQYYKGAMTLSQTTLSTMTHEQHTAKHSCYTKCHFIDLYADRCYNECRKAECHHAECHYAECHYDERHYAVSF